MAKNFAQIIIEHCSECPHSKLIGPYWNDEFEEEDYKVHCNKLGRIVQSDMSWNEVAAKCNPPLHCLDTVPKDCPYIMGGSQDIYSKLGMK